MPVNQRIMDNLKKQYGPKKGEEVYYAMVNKGTIKEEAEAGYPEKMRIGGPVKQDKKMQLGKLNNQSTKKEDE